MAEAALSFDYVIVGAGSAGCLLANRLSADPRVRVLLLEAGGRNDWIWLKIPVGYIRAIGSERADWRFTAEPDAGLGGRAIAYPRGKVVGGSSSINGMLYIRGQAADYDHWRQLGLTGWGWDDLLPHFKRHERFFGSDPAHHGNDGELHVQQARLHMPVLDVIREAAIQHGIPATTDFNTGDNEGVGPLHVTQRNGERWSAARAFLEPALQRPNLVLETDAHVQRVLIEEGRATGIAYMRGGEQRRATAGRDVILSAGAIGSPQILMLSGIGPGAHLQEMGIEPVLDRPGVGRHLLDHQQIRMLYRIEGARTLNERLNSRRGKVAMAMQYALTRRGPLTMAPAQLGMFTRSEPKLERADIGFIAMAFSRQRFDAPFDPFPGITMGSYILRPTSEGHIRLRSRDPMAPPAITLNYLSTQQDRRIAANALRVTRQIIRQPALAKYRPVETLPGASVSDDDEEGLVEAAAQASTTMFHPVGTVKMGLPSDPRAVVDGQLRVMGIAGLRVIDASVMPDIPSGNTNAPTIMIAEKAASMLLARA